jgi:hypothetical protein
LCALLVIQFPPSIIILDWFLSLVLTYIVFHQTESSEQTSKPLYMKPLYVNVIKTWVVIKLSYLLDSEVFYVHPSVLLLWRYLVLAHIVISS